MQNFNYHCHTSFGNIFDGKNTADEMLSAYEAKGFKEIGFSNHCIINPVFEKLPFMHTQNLTDINKAIDIYKRMFDDIDQAAEKHKIKVHKGFEVDFFISKNWRSDFERIIRELKPDYLISANHFLRNDDDTYICSIFNLKNMFSVSKKEKDQMLKNYWKRILSAIDSGYFDFVAHFDYCCMFDLATGSEWDDIKMEVVERIASQKIACEINTSGLRQKREDIKILNRPFPDWWLIKELIKRNVPLIISDDAHRIAETGFGFLETEKKLKELNCKNRYKL